MLSLAVAKGSMHAIVNGSTGDLLESLGILPQEMELVKGDTPWVALHRNTVTRTIDALIFGSMDILGLPRFEVPAEYTAAAIIMFVSPVNLQVGCRWVECGSSAQNLAESAIVSPGFQKAGAAQLFSLCLQLHKDEVVGRYKSLFESKVNKSLNTAMNINGGAGDAKKSRS